MGVADIHESEDLARAVCESPGMVEAAFAVMEAEQPIRQIIIERFAKSVEERAAGRGWHVIRNNLGPDRHSGFLIGFSPESTIGFGFQFDQTRYGWLFYGVASEDASSLPPRTKQVLRSLMGSEAGTEYWPVWKGVGPNDRHFPLARQADREFWLAAYDGRLADMLVGFVTEAEAALRKADLLDAVRRR